MNIAEMLRNAADQVERKDREKDDLECTVARLGRVNDEMCDDMTSLRGELRVAQARITELEAALHRSGQAIHW